MAVAQQRFIRKVEKVVQEVKNPTSGDKPYQIVQEYEEWEIVSTEGIKSIDKRAVKQAMHIISTETFDKVAEVEKREASKPKNRAKAQKQVAEKVTNNKE